MALYLAGVVECCAMARSPYWDISPRPLIVGLRRLALDDGRTHAAWRKWTPERAKRHEVLAASSFLSHHRTAKHGNLQSLAACWALDDLPIPKAGCRRCILIAAFLKFQIGITAC